MDLFGVFRLMAGNRQLLVLLVFAFLLHLGLISFAPVQIEAWGQTLSFGQNTILVVTLICCAWLIARGSWERVKSARLETAIKTLLPHEKPYTFTFDTAGVFRNSRDVVLPQRWGTMVQPKGTSDPEYDGICREAMQRLDAYCFSGKAPPFRFGGENEATSKLSLATTIRSAPGKEDGKGLTGFGFIENARQSGDRSRFIVATDERVSHPDLDSSVLSVFSLRADVPITLRQYISPVGPERYFSVHLLIPFRRKHMFAKWRVHPILMFVDDIAGSPQEGHVFDKRKKLLLGYGGQDV